MSNKCNNLTILQEIGVKVPEFKSFNITENDLDTFEENFTKFISTFYNPFFEGQFSVRSSGSISTPGRMKTILQVENRIPSILEAAIEVFKSTQSNRLKLYLGLKGVKDFSSAIIVQQMVYPMMNKSSCSGVLTTCHPITGDNTEYGELIYGKFGDKLMAGEGSPLKLKSLELVNPVAYERLIEEVEKIRVNFDNHQEIEFVVEDTDVWILQTRDYKKVTPMAIDFDGYEIIGIGRPAIPRGAMGVITHKKESITNDSIFVTNTTDWEDTKDILKAKGVITLSGGALSHAAIIARDFEIPCITGAKFHDELVEGTKIGMDSKGRIYKL